MDDSVRALLADARLVALSREPTDGWIRAKSGALEKTSVFVATRFSARVGFTGGDGADAPYVLLRMFSEDVEFVWCELREDGRAAKWDAHSSEHLLALAREVFY
jgi:hypothetical protein